MDLKSTDIIHFSIPSWDKYQKRNTAHYFRVETGIFDDPKISSLTSKQLHLYLYLLTRCGHDSASRSTFMCQRAANLLPSRCQRLANDLCKLSELGLIILENTPKERKKERKKVEPPKSALLELGDFEEIYNIYPRKRGKKKGLALLKKIPLASFGEVKKAIQNYSDHCTASKTEDKFIMYFSTFMNCWEDWLEPVKAIKKEKYDRSKVW